ncbi:MAG: zinc-ribbon domain-containing protein [Myxococcota bacterium]
MEVKCPKCQTIYHLDEVHLPLEGANVKCTTCHNVFKVIPPTAPSVQPVSSWHLKRPDGTIINFAHLGELQKLILEHKAHLEDMISKDGLSYKKLSDMPEFAPLFIKRNRQQEADHKSGATSAEKKEPQPEQSLSTPPVQSVVTPISIPEDEDIDIYGRPKKKGKKGGLLVAIGIIIIVVVAVVLFLFRDKVFGTKLTEEELSAIRTAEQEMLLLDYVNLEKAYDTLNQFMKNPERPPKVEVLAAYTYSLLLRGELLKLENFVVEKRIRETLKIDRYSEVAKKLNEGFNERQRLIQDLSNQTSTELKRLDMNFGSKPIAKYIALEYIRIQSIFDKGSAEKGKEILKELKGIKDFAYANRLKFIEGDLLLKTDEQRSEEGIKLVREAADSEKGFILPYFMLARYYVAKGEYDKAVEAINTILNTNPSNSVAKSLKGHIEELINITRGGQVSKVEDTQVKPEEGKAEEKKVEGQTVEEKKREVEKGTEPSKMEERPSESKEKKEEAVLAKPKAEKVVATEGKVAGNYAQLIKQAKQFAKKGQYDKAADTFLQAAEIEPGLAEPFLAMGWMYIDAGKNEQAVSAFSRAIKLKGNKCDGYMGLGEANKYLKKNAEAKKYYQMYLEQCPDGPDAPAAKNSLNSLK